MLTTIAIVVLLLTLTRAAWAATHHRKHYVSPLWIADARCETGHIAPWLPVIPRWDWGKYAGTPRQRPKEGFTYEGGIGFAHSTWVWWAGKLGYLARYPHAYDAPAWVQALVAQYGLDNYGTWGCLRNPSVAALI